MLWQERRRGVIFLHNSKKLLASAESNIPKCYEQCYTIYSWIKYTYQQASNLSAKKCFGLILRGDNIITITMIIIFIIIKYYSINNIHPWMENWTKETRQPENEEMCNIYLQASLRFINSYTKEILKMLWTWAPHRTAMLVYSLPVKSRIFFSLCVFDAFAAHAGLADVTDTD